ncbi:MAG: hypothetical protein QM535_15120 [Limnohabitans sp.]|nr:hypothetical protein [Limnohabitans sp.]
MPESQNIEYKQSWRDEYLKWICGFANANGGNFFMGKETGNLMSKGGAIQKTITKINNDFVDKGAFVTAIKKIQLRWVESSNKIVSYLINIDKFNNENQFLGANNLLQLKTLIKKINKPLSC